MERDQPEELERKTEPVDVSYACRPKESTFQRYVSYARKSSPYVKGGVAVALITGLSGLAMWLHANSALMNQGGFN